MLEIVHDLAPGADLYFATATGGPARFAANIEALCEAGAHIIVDDIGYRREAVFQDGIVAQGVNAAVADGCIYFSAAGNDGNMDSMTSGVWEGNFVAGDYVPFGDRAGMSHIFDGRSGATANQIIGPFLGTVCLKWSDSYGDSLSDYDLYLIHPTFTIPSTNDQTTSRIALECVGPIRDGFGNLVDLVDSQLLVVRVAGDTGDNRYLHLNTYGGQLLFSTSGAMYGHPAATPTIAVAATDVGRAGGVGGRFDGTEAIETFSSDGPRRIFFDSNNQVITLGNLSSSGGRELPKPEVTAANRVTTSTPGFETFPGTSAAAPHAAAIAALMLEAAGGPGSLTRAEVLAAMQDTALDIEGTGWDRNSGRGIINALAAVDRVAR